VPQDAGTDISGLARQESQSGFRFEFFRPDNAKESISATEAMTVPNPHHMLYLMEGRPYPDLLRQGLEARLKEGGRLGYTPNAGFENSALREGLARELSRDFGFRLTPEVLHLGPDADTVLQGLLRVLPTERGVLFAGHGADTVPLPLEPYTPRLVGPNFAAIEAALGEANPSVLVLQLPRDAWADRAGLNQLLRNSAARGIHTLVLEDQPLRLSNASHPLLEVLSASIPAAEHTHILHSLDRRYATPALPLAALVSGNRMLQFYMNRYADLTHSRASSLTQDAYARFLERAGESEPLPEGLPGVLDSILTTFTPSERVARALESKSAFDSSPRGEHPDPIAMNFGESEWNPRIRLGEGLWDAARAPRVELESTARQAVVEYLLQSRGVRVEPEQILLGAGVQPLLVSAIRGLRDISGGSLQVAVPRPSYGLFFPTVELGGAKMVEYPTRPEGRFLTENGALLRELNTGSRLSAVLINEPNNPAGQFHSPESLRLISQQIRSAKGYLLFDDVFGMLDFGRGRQRRTPSMSLLQQELGSRLVAFGGVSKEFAAGGLRFGFALVGDPRLAQAMQRHAAPSPDPLALTVAPAMLSHWRPLVEEHRTYLSSRAYQLEQVFRERQLPILEAQGGYSLLANLEFLYGRRMRLRGGGEAVLGPNNLHDLLYSEAGLKVYSDAWAHQPHHYRLVFSIDRIEEAANRLRKFFRAAR
ncbi:MAG TPA: aminotransferase class I/II-fold pyridoxal phosphate-dependent enzyme, partial [bacterium]|nr:aminotransferase class I/II-fold pyridoxal phosphate-dependent enzyme [bacterium]